MIMNKYVAYLPSWMFNLSAIKNKKAGELREGEAARPD